jgi:hypothetical protein
MNPVQVLTSYFFKIRKTRIKLHERRFTKFGGSVKSETHIQLKTGSVDNRIQELLVYLGGVLTTSGVLTLCEVAILRITHTIYGTPHDARRQEQRK